jgi:NAD-dependent DNA ligase
MMAETRYCQYCGAEFVTDNNRKIFCSGECKCKARRKRKAEETVKVNLKKANITIEDMVDEMLRLSKEKGRIVQYGELSQMLLTGRHTIEKRGRKNG